MARRQTQAAHASSTAFPLHAVLCIHLLCQVSKYKLKELPSQLMRMTSRLYSREAVVHQQCQAVNKAGVTLNSGFLTIGGPPLVLAFSPDCLSLSPEGTCLSPERCPGSPAALVCNSLGGRRRGEKIPISAASFEVGDRAEEESRCSRLLRGDSCGDSGPA